MGDDEPYRRPEREETFVLSGRAISARVKLNIYRVDYLGAEILVNGVLVKEIYPSGYSGPIEIEVPENLLPLPVGPNKVTVRAKTREDGQMEDFEYDRLKVIATIEAPVACVRALAQKLGRALAWIVWGAWFLAIFTAGFRWWYPGPRWPIRTEIPTRFVRATAYAIWHGGKRLISYAILVGVPVVVAGWIAYSHMSGTPPESYIQVLEIVLSRSLEKMIYVLVQC